MPILPRDPSRPTHPRAFTMIQLIVVLAIVALGLALLIPMIQRNRDQANWILCRDHLRQVGIALRNYANTHGGEFPVSPTLQNPQGELTALLASTLMDPQNLYCPAEKNPSLAYSAANLKAGTIGYFYYSAQGSGDDPSLSKFLLNGISWPRKITTDMDARSWLMSDRWFSGLPTNHAGFNKGVNYLMLDGSVDFIGDSPRGAFH